MGVKIVNDNTDLVKKELDLKIERSLFIISQKMENYAKAKCPVRTSRLKNSIAHDYSVQAKVAAVGTNVEYAPYVELGARGRDPKYFLKGSIDNHINEYKFIFENEMKK